MRKTKRILAVLVALVMTFALLPTVAFAAELEKPNYTLSTSGGVKITPTAADGYAFYYTASTTSIAAPTYGDNINTISGATVMSGETSIPGASGDEVFYVRIYKVETSGSTITGFEEATLFTTLTAGSIYTGTIDVRDNGVSVGTFSYVYSPNLWTQEYLLAGIKSGLSAPYAALLNPTDSAGFVETGWYANYSTTGDVTVDTEAAKNQASWRSVEDIVETLFGQAYQNESTDGGRTVTIEYMVSARNAYEVLPDGTFQKAQPAPQYPYNVAYTIYESTAATVGLRSNARLIVDGEDYVRYGGIGEYEPVEGATYDILTNTLTLNGYNGGAIEAENMDLNIVLAGTNNINTTNNCIDINGKLTISGGGTLTAVIPSESGASAIFANAVDIQEGTLNLTAPLGSGISSVSSITVNASAARVTAFGKYGLYGNTITITGAADIKEGDDTEYAEPVTTLTLSDKGSDKYSKPYVSIAPGTPATTYAITVQNDGNGTAKASATTATAGTQITLTATPNSGYRFKEWQVVSGGVTITSNKLTMPENAVIVKAIFEAIPGGGDPTPTPYTVTQNPGTYSGSGDAVATIEGPFNEFIRLILGGNTVAEGNYTKAAGSTIITLNESYVKTLAVGTHTFTAEYTNGYADFTVTIRAAEPTPTPTPSNPAPTPSNPTVPQTGDNSNAGLWSILLVISALGILGAVVWQKKRSKEAQSE